LGYNKYLRPGAGSREPGAGSREPGAGSREPGAGSPPVFGLSPEWLLHDGKVFADAIVLSHDEQLERLSRYCPEAVEAATVAGDPCLDRLRASLHLRDTYRRALGLSPGRRLVVISSTWGPRSLYGLHPEMALRFACDLPIDRYRTAIALHPNVWDGNSPWQIRLWLAAARRAGVHLLSPWEQWRAALVAADVVVGDFGSVPLYAAAIGRPVLIAATHPDGLDPASPVARFTAAAPALRVDRALDDQLEDVIAEPRRDAYELILNELTAAPGSAATRLRALFYRLMRLPEPDHRPLTLVVPVPTGEPAAPTAVIVATGLSRDGRTLRMARFPAGPRLAGPPPGDSHLLVEWRHPDPSLLAHADVLVCDPADTFDPPEVWIRRTLHDRPGCLVAAAGDVIGVRGGATARLTAVPAPAEPDKQDRLTAERAAAEQGRPDQPTAEPALAEQGRPDLPAAVLASAVHGWLAAGRSLDEIGEAMPVLLLGGRGPVRLRVVPPADPPPQPPAGPTAAHTP
jgi:hypothetical protein